MNYFSRNMTQPSRQAGCPTLTAGVMEVALNRPKELNASGEPKVSKCGESSCWISATNWAPEKSGYTVNPIKTR